MRKWCLIILAVLLLAGCGVETQDEERLQDLDFTVMDLEKVPEELRNVLEEKKSKSFKVTYEDEGYLYICVGYGEQKTSGYSICQGSVSDKKRDLCGYRTGGSRKPGTDGRSGDLPLYSTEIRVS